MHRLAGALLVALGLALSPWPGAPVAFDVPPVGSGFSRAPAGIPARSAFDVCPVGSGFSRIPEMQSAGTGAAARTVPVRYTAGVVLDVPAGALNQPTVFDVTDIACPAADVVLGRARYATHQERCLGGFDARPDGLWFAVPVTATIPVLPLDPFEFPMQGVVDLAAETSSLLATDLTYRGDAHVLAPTQGGGCSVSTASVSASVSQRVRIADVGWNPFVGWIFSCSGKFTTPGAGGAVWRGDREASATDGPRPAGAGPAR